VIVRLPFRPPVHGFHFANHFVSRFAGGLGIEFPGLCGGMCLAAFNYFRYGLPIPPHVDSEIDFNVSFEILRTGPETTSLVNYIFHSQVATFENAAALSAFGLFDPPFGPELSKAKARVDRGEYVIFGLKNRRENPGLGHQVLCYGYDSDAGAAIVYDPNKPDQEVAITSTRVGNDEVLILRSDRGEEDHTYRAMFEWQELIAARVSDRVTYDWPDNVFRNLNFAVRPPFVNMQSGWRWCRKCFGMWFATHDTPGVCPAGDGHSSEGSGAYLLCMNYRQSSSQAGWRWCRKCQGLYFGPSKSVCPAGDEHDGSASADYTMVSGAAGNAAFTQDNWRWCHKCQGMHYAAGGVCPAKGPHDPSYSGAYVMLHE